MLDLVAPQAFRLSLGDLAGPGTDEGHHRRHRLERRRRSCSTPARRTCRTIDSVWPGNASGTVMRPTETRRSGSAVRQRPEEHAVERREERRGGAEAERQHEDGRRARSRAGAATSAR